MKENIKSEKNEKIVLTTKKQFDIIYKSHSGKNNAEATENLEN